MLEKIDSGAVGHVTKSTIVEMGCCLGVDQTVAMNAQAREKSNGEKVVKVLRFTISVTPGYALAISDEYPFTGMIQFPQYEMTIVQITKTLVFKNVTVEIVSRKYGNTDRVTYAAEIDIKSRVTNMSIRNVFSMIVGMVGITNRMIGLINSDFMSMVMSKDHIVRDVASADGIPGTFMTKADGLKVYVFIYDFGYVVCLTDSTLTVISSTIVVGPEMMIEMTDKPNIMVAEMMMNRSLVYIDYLAADGNVIISIETKMTMIANRHSMRARV